MTEDAGHQWVREFRDRVGWGLQAIPLPHDPTPASRVMTAGSLADSLGFDAFFLGDHPAYAPEVWLHLGALAVQTSRVRLGSVVLCAGYRPPVLTARLTADLDNLSKGVPSLGSVTVGTRQNSRNSIFPSLRCPSDRRRWLNQSRSSAACGGRSHSPIGGQLSQHRAKNASSHRPCSSHRHRSFWPVAANAPRSAS